ncbi:MAG: hypothetical protein M3O07_09275 [Pseudomonadota bacterium]|nr:hypothetical protein [Pseudomonadota bacterium]
MVRALSGISGLFALLVLAGAQSAHAQNWQLTDGAARDVGVGADGSVWVIGTNAVGGGYGIYRRTNNTWVNVPGGAERIAVDPQGNAWVVNNTNTISRFDGSQWVTVSGQTARDIGVGANGTVWAIGTVAEAGGYAIHRSTDKGASWVKIPGSAVRVSVDPQGNGWVVNNTNNIFRFDGSKWVQLTGAATDVGIGADGAAWVIGTDNGIYRWENNNWAKKPGGAAQIAAGPHGAVWVVNQGNQIYQANAPLAPGLAVAAAVASPTAPVAAPAPAPAPATLTATTIAVPPPATPTTGSVTIPTATVIPTPTINITQPATTPVVIPNQNLNISPPGTAPAGPVSWVRTDGGARDIGVGANGSVWAIGTNAVGGGYGIYRRTNNTWVNVPGGAERIAVDPQGNAWVVNNSNTIFRHDGSQWVTVAGQAARDIGIGANGTVWVIGTNVEAGGFGIYRSTDRGASWVKIPGSAVRVSVDPQGNAWVVNNANAIFRFNGSTWVTQPGTATDVGIGADGSAWVIGADTAIYRFEGSNWVNKTGNAAQIAAGPGGAVWVVQRGGEIYQAQTGSAAAVAQAAPTPLNIPAGTIVLQGTTSIPVTGTTGGTGSTVAVPGSGGGGLVVGSPTLPGTTQTPLTVTGSIDTSNMIGAVGTSQATCGVPGKPLCNPSAAELVGNSDVTCPSGSFPDLGRSACYSCPEGFTRSIHAVDDYKACQKPDSSISGGFQAATFQAPLCAAGSFYDPIRGGECYSCPAGYNRSAAHIDATNACYIPIHEKFSHATKGRVTVWPHDCSSGTFWDGYNGGACYSCPSGFGRTAYHITDAKACAQMAGETHARATLVKKAECGPGEIRDMYVQGTQNPAFGGGCWTCPIGTDRSIHPVTGASACERAAGIQWASATRTRGMTCEPHEIFDPISSGNSAVASALATRNSGSTSPVTAKTIGGTCWTCPANYKRSTGAVYATTACTPPDIVWAAAPYNQPGLFGLSGAEAVALKLVNERTTLNTLIRDIQAAGNAPANFAQATWDQIATRPQDSPILALAVFSRVVAASTTPASATPEELALLQDVKAHIRKHREFMAQNALDAYRAWKGGETYRTQHYAQSQLMVMTNIGKVPPDFELITAESIMGGLGAAVAANTAIYMTMSSAAVYKALFPFAVREITKQIVAQATQAGITMTKFGIATATKAASAAAGAAMSAGPQIIVTVGLIILQAAIEQQIAIAEAEPKLLTGLTTAQNFDADFKRLMATSEGTSQAQGYWSMLLSGPAPRVDGSRPAAIGPQNLQAFAQGAAVAKQTLAAN